MRTCPRHGRIYDYRFNHGGRARWRCRRCVGEAVTRRKQKVRRTLIEEAGGRCAICGYDRCVVNMHFHHVDPAAKELNMTAAVGRSLAAFRQRRRSASCSAPTVMARSRPG